MSEWIEACHKRDALQAELNHPSMSRVYETQARESNATIFWLSSAHTANDRRNFKRTDVFEDIPDRLPSYAAPTLLFRPDGFKVAMGTTPISRQLVLVQGPSTGEVTRWSVAACGVKG
jgi:hypothetical protein